MPRLLLFVLLFITGLTSDVSAAVAAPPPPANTEVAVPTRADLEEKLGRKLTFRERLAVKILAKKQKKQARKTRQRGDGYSNGWAIAGFVLGILSLLGLSIIAGIPAIIFSAIGLRKAKWEGLPNRGLAMAGLICGIISVALLVLLVALAAVFFAA